MLINTDVATYLRQPLDQLDAPALQQIVDITNGLLQDTAGPLPDPMPSGAFAIALEVAARAYRNPEGVTEERAGIFTKRIAVTARNGVYLTEDERADFIAAVTGTPLGDYGPWAGSMQYK